MLCLVFEKIFFNTSLVKSWLVASWFLLLNLEFIFSWILILLDVFSWILKSILILNLLTQSWHHSFGLFVIIKTIWIILDSSSWSLLLHNVLWMFRPNPSKTMMPKKCSMWIIDSPLVWTNITSMVMIAIFYVWLAITGHEGFYLGFSVFVCGFWERQRLKVKNVKFWYQGTDVVQDVTTSRFRTCSLCVSVWTD